MYIRRLYRSNKSWILIIPAELSRKWQLGITRYVCILDTVDGILIKPFKLEDLKGNKEVKKNEVDEDKREVY